MAITCEIVEEVGKFGKFECNIVDWGNKGPKVDLREWYTDNDGNTKPGKGITLKKEQIDTVIKYLERCKEIL